MYKPLNEEDSFREINLLKQKGISFDKAIQNIALLHYVAEKNNVPVSLLLDDCKSRQKNREILK